MPSRFDESLAIWGSPTDTEDCTTLKTGEVEAEGGAQFESRTNTKVEVSDSQRNKLLFETDFFIPANSR